MDRPSGVLLLEIATAAQCSRLNAIERKAEQLIDYLGRPSYTALGELLDIGEDRSRGGNNA